MAGIQLASNGSQCHSATFSEAFSKPAHTDMAGAAESHRIIYHFPFVPSVYFLISLHALVDDCSSTHRLMQYLLFTEGEEYSAKLNN